MPAALDTLVCGLYVCIDDFLGPRHVGPGRPPKLTDSELICLAVAQVLLGVPNDRQFLALARWRLGHLFPQLIDQSGYNRRLRQLAPQIARCISYLAWISPSFCDRLKAPGLNAGALRSVARDGAPFGIRRARRLRLLPIAQPLFLGLPALPDLRGRRDADRLGTRGRQYR
jgi:hypothetical protein